MSGEKEREHKPCLIKSSNFPIATNPARYWLAPLQSLEDKLYSVQVLEKSMSERVAN